MKPDSRGYAAPLPLAGDTSCRVSSGLFASPGGQSREAGTEGGCEV